MWGPWVVQLVEPLTVGFGWGYDLRVLGLRPALGSMLMPSPFAPPPLICTLFLKQINKS